MTDSFKRKHCPAPDQFRNPKTHQCKKCVGFDDNELRTYARSIGFPVNPNDDKAKICRDVFSQLTDNERSLVDKYVSGEARFSRQLQGMMPEYMRMRPEPVPASVTKTRVGRTTAAAKPAVPTAAPTVPPAPSPVDLPMLTVYVPVLEILEDKTGLSPVAKQNFLRRDGSGFYDVPEAIETLVENLPKVFNSLKLDQKQRILYQTDSNGKLIKTLSGHVKQATLDDLLAQIRNVEKLTRLDTYKNPGLTIYIYNISGESIGRMRIYLEKRRRLPLTEDEAGMAALEKSAEKMYIDEQAAKRGRQASFWAPSAPRSSAPQTLPTKMYEYGPLIVSYNSQDGVASIMIDGKQVVVYSDVINVLPKSKFALILLPNKNIIFAGLDINDPPLPFVYQLTLEPGDSIEKLEETPRRHLWGTNHVYFLGTGALLTKEEYDRFAPFQFEGAPFKRFKVHLLK